MMVQIAVAGGTGHLGRTLIEGLVESGEHDVYVLTRKVLYLMCLFQFFHSN
jgi:nucleoside-diphosphate-sugar epimerase